MLIGEFKALIYSYYNRFCEINQNHTFTVMNPEIIIVDDEEFLETLYEINNQYKDDTARMSEEEIYKHFSSCDAATIRTEGIDYIVLSYREENYTAPAIIAFYHELGHLLSLSSQDMNNPLELEKRDDDRKSGFLFWKEFIADYIALNTFHQDYERFRIDGNEVKDFMNTVLPKISSRNLMAIQLGAMSELANMYAFLLNLNMMEKDISKIKFPINNKNSVGKALESYLREMLELLYEKCNSKSPVVTNETFLAKIGYIAVEILLFADDYYGNMGWQ